MAHLTLAGVSDDGKRLLLLDDQGTEFTLDVTPALRSAVRGDATRLGQLEIPMDSALRPRDIQARIRAGETPEQVAQIAHTSVDKIMPFVAPVLAEREHVAERAQRAHVRRPSTDSGSGSGSGSRTLGDVVAVHLRSANVDPGTVRWDAWRREDGRWTLAAAYAVGARTGTGHFTYDAPGSYVVIDDDDARWLVGDGAATPAAEPADDLREARERRLSAVPPRQPAPPDDELPLGDDAIELVSDDDVAADSANAVADRADDRADDPADDPADDEAGTAEIPAAVEPEPATEEPAPVEEPVAEEPARRPKRKGRASVPSWDEIMFGGGDAPR
jgi:hypothetical protein